MPKPSAQPYRFTATKATPQAKTEKSPRRRGIHTTVFAFAAIGSLAFAGMWNPPVGSVHAFTNASDYRAEKESGCTNSGAGCHGDEKSYADFNAYHPNSECTTCHEVEGVGCIPCHSPKNHECPVCHDGTMKEAPDRVKITDPYPRGHYRETTHTAMGSDFSATMTAAAGGKAGATCKNCHSRDLSASHTGVPIIAGSEYGESVGCGECHNDVRSFGMAEVLDDWKDRSCDACHRVGSSSPMHSDTLAGDTKAKSPKSCGKTGSGCHETNVLHALHPDKPANCSGVAEDGEPGCHDFEIQSSKPDAITCGGGEKSCHPEYENDEYSHKRDEVIHSPKGKAAGADTSYYDTACTGCHFMDPDGVSLVTEHELASSSRPDAGVCRGCHNHDASAAAIADDWADRDAAGACSACHGHDGLDDAHASDLAPLHQATGSAGCAGSGDGCHAGGDLLDVGDDGLHKNCLRCHDRSPSGGNVAYSPGSTSCGEGRDCHSPAGAYDPATAVHNGTGGLTDGRDPAHRATDLAAASLTDTATALSVGCTSCHSDRLGIEHDRSSSSISSGSGTTCARCHNHSNATVIAVLTDWNMQGAEDSCDACHGRDDIEEPHLRIGPSHIGNELALDGTDSPGACASGGCHGEAELRKLHVKSGCTPTGCHRSSGAMLGRNTKSCGGPLTGSACHAGYSATTGHSEDALNHGGIELDVLGNPSSGYCARLGCHTTVNVRTLHGDTGCLLSNCHAPGTLVPSKTCGGSDAAVSCHVGFSTSEHFVDHSADHTGTVNGIAYGPGVNVGCFGCHSADVMTEHSSAEGAAITGGGASSCRVCHYNADDAGNGAYATLSSVTSAVAGGDFRCIACHASGSAVPGGGFAASAHKNASAEPVLPQGFVWTDPAEDWAAAFASPVGGGHNVSAFVASPAKAFPITSYDDGVREWIWNLTPNSGFTRWLKWGSGASAATMRGYVVTCASCHVLPAEMEGPHGSAVPIAIDPAYSQTEYANPTRGLQSQFETTGTARVVCMKCHNMLAGSVSGTSTPGGHPVHAQHAQHNRYPSHHPVRYGEKCVDCHVRIPHAWKSARLLVRTVPGSGRPADAFPYIREGYDGLAGIVLNDIFTPEDLGPSSCVTGGCHGYHDETTHPEPADIPGAQYWP